MSNFPEFKTTMDLDDAGPLTRTEKLEIIQEGVSKKVDLHVALHRDYYDLATTSGVGVDGKVQQVTKIDNTANTAKVVTIANPPAGRAMTFVFVIQGNAGTFTWPGTIVWDKNTQPKLGATRTLVVVFWDGNNFTGNQGPTA